jgi:hypothetical protein
MDIGFNVGAAWLRNGDLMPPPESPPRDHPIRSLVYGVSIDVGYESASGRLFLGPYLRVDQHANRKTNPVLAWGSLIESGAQVRIRPTRRWAFGIHGGVLARLASTIFGYGLGADVALQIVPCCPDLKEDERLEVVLGLTSQVPVQFQDASGAHDVDNRAVALSIGIRGSLGSPLDFQ